MEVDALLRKGVSTRHNVCPVLQNGLAQKAVGYRLPIDKHLVLFNGRQSP